MPPRKHTAKSQEHVYVKVGKGERSRYKMQALQIPRVNGVSDNTTPSLSSIPPAPVVSPPTMDNHPSYDSDAYEFMPKRTGKVR
jgi:hypothetical protein